MVLTFFDYVFYKVCNAYSKTSDSRPEGSAFCVVSLLKGLNILTLLFFFEIITRNKFSVTKYSVAGLMILLLVLNYIRYINKENRTYKSLTEKWADETKKKRKGILIVFYIILTIVLSFGLAIYMGSK